MLRLLQDYPPDSLFIFCAASRRQDLAEGPFHARPKTLFPEISGRQNRFVVHACMSLNRLLIPVLALALLRVIRKWKPTVILSIAHGYYFLAATLAARWAGVPLILIVHDDWVPMNRHVRIFRRFARPLFGWALRHAAHVYAVCGAMQAHLKEEYGIDSELQYAATSPNPYATAPHEGNGLPIRIVFTGSVYPSVSQSVGLVVRALHEFEHNAELHLYSKISQQNLHTLGWDVDHVRSHGWIPQVEVQRVLAQADILFLPLSFDLRDGYSAKTSFPSKFADYLAAGRPILLVAPADSPVAAYAQATRCADVVSEPSERAIVEALQRLVASPAYAAQLARIAGKVFLRNHDIQEQRRLFQEVLCRLQSSAC
jgi:glycosyltransferase involved in cell wall biosynthesis